MDHFLPFKFKSSPHKLLPDEDYLSGESLLSNQPEISLRPSRLRSSIPIIAHVVVIGIYTAIFLVVTHNWHSGKTHGVGDIHTPARPGLMYESQIFSVPLEIKSAYVGEPRAELDHAWHELLQYTNIQVSEDEMRRISRLDEGIKLPGGGYFGSLMVYHQLHCIKRLYQYFYAEHYFPNMTDIEKEHSRQHNTHCLDILRQGIQCQGDASLVTMRWGQQQAIPLGNFTSPHECVNWDALNDWAKERSVDVFAPGVLVHPTLGPSFPNGKGERIGVAEDN